MPKLPNIAEIENNFYRRGRRGAQRKIGEKGLPLITRTNADQDESYGGSAEKRGEDRVIVRDRRDRRDRKRAFTAEVAEERRGRSGKRLTADYADERGSGNIARNTKIAKHRRNWKTCRGEERKRSGELVIGKIQNWKSPALRWQVPDEPFNMSCDQKLQAV